VKRIVPLFLLLAFIAGACAPLSLVSGSPTQEPTRQAEVQPSQPAARSTVLPTGENGANSGTARAHIQALTGMGARWSGSAEEAEAGRYIATAFNEMGYASELQPFTAVGEDGETIESANIMAVKEGDSAEVIVVGAHYDSSDEGLGADDNASGVAVMLAAAARVKDEATPYTINFVAFGAEEAGLLGSDVFVSSLSGSEVLNVILFVNLDSLISGDITYIYSPENEAAARDWALAWSAANGYDLQTIRNVDLSVDGYATADYEAFDLAGIPWIYFEATNWNLGDQDGYTKVDPQYGDQGGIIHTQYDTLQYLDQTFPGRVDQHLDLFVNVLYRLLVEYRR
jgi:alkaline phosphatase isozyme conversion protein